MISRRGTEKNARRWVNGNVVSNHRRSWAIVGGICVQIDGLSARKLVIAGKRKEGNRRTNEN